MYHSIKTFRRFVKLDSIFGASETIVFESSGKARVYSSYNILRLSGSGKVRILVRRRHEKGCTLVCRSLT